MPVIIHSGSQAAKHPRADEHPEHLADKRTQSGQKSRGIDQFADSWVWKVVESHNEPFISSYISTAINNCFFKANKLLGVQNARFLAKTIPEFICLMATALQCHPNRYFATGNIVQPLLYNSANARDMYKRHVEMWEDAYNIQEITDIVMELIRQLVTDIRQQNGKVISRVALPKQMTIPWCKGHDIYWKEKLDAIHREQLQDDLG
ncbi:hypothetical protein BDD12DRAFT_893339 [Trichophaea hybrida]|nr:hypothetical protein BDD12DRAFT_893339 [Trichophaea hybrida]